MVKYNIDLNRNTILITGAAGFIGANLALRICNENPEATVIGLDNLNEYYDVNIKQYRLERLRKCPNFTFFKGDIADLQIFDTNLTPEEVQNLVKTGKTYDIEALKFSLDRGAIEKISVEEKCGNVDVEGSVLPFRKTGRFRCLPHEDEGIVGGRFKKGETTARNERRYQLEMQQGKVNYKKDGIAQVKFELLGIDQLTPKAKMINVRL